MLLWGIKCIPENLWDRGTNVPQIHSQISDKTFYLGSILPHTLIKYMHILIKLEIYIVKRMSTLKNCCQFTALKNYNLVFFSTPLILSLSFIKKLRKKELFLTSQRNNSFTDVISSWHGVDMKMEFTYCLPVTHIVNNSCPSILVAYFDITAQFWKLQQT